MSAILSADDLNDFITPGVACIKPVESLPTRPDDPSSSPQNPRGGEVILDGQHQQHASESTASTGPTHISLTDCLACSGCVTSAEAVLVSLQSHAEVLKALDAAPALRVTARGGGGGGVGVCDNEMVSLEGGTGGGNVDDDGSRTLFVASVSPQTRANIAAACGAGVSEEEAGHMLERLLRGPEGLAAGGRWGNGFSWVVDTNAAREACLVLGADEVLDGPAAAAGRTPVLTSSCPGWVCYAEKTQPHVLPHLSRVKSPQALTGTILKTVLGRSLGISPSRIWHLAVMPCFDKKLEASRDELTDAAWGGGGDAVPGRGVRDVDCVITSKEILMLAESRGLDFFGFSRARLSNLDTAPPFPDPTFASFFFPSRRARRPPAVAGSSGGNLHFVLQAVASRHPGSQVHTARGRNADVLESKVVSASGDVIFRAARYYGFRNIQNLVRKLKPVKPSRLPGARPAGSARKPGPKSTSGSDYAYVEVMACPGGCTNGGGQIGLDDPVMMDRRNLAGRPGIDDQKDWMAEVDEAYYSADDGFGSKAEGGGMSAEGVVPGDAGVIDGISLSHTRDVLTFWSRMVGVDLDKLAFTTFREVISDVGKGQTSDAERVARLAGKIDGGW